jgi:SEC-C motif
MGAPSRNAPCPCGSGSKYKRCCLAAEQRERETAGFEDAVGRRMSTWAVREFPEEFRAGLEQFGGSDRALDDRDAQSFANWVCSDRELAGGGTSAQRYAARAELDTRERYVAARIADARLGLQRVRAVEPGRWIELEHVLSGEVVRVRSGEVSREAARWDVLLCRVMDDDRAPSLWGPVLFYAPDEEPELVAELERLADAHGVAGPDRLAGVFRVAALELMRFVPASRRVERSFFTAEGDQLVDGRASWQVGDALAALELLDSPPELAWVGESEDGSGEAIQWTVERAPLLADRPPLPAGAICFESSLTGLPGRICLATFELTDEELRCTAMSEARLDAAISLVVERLGALAELRERTAVPFEPDLSRPRPRGRPRRPREPPPGLTAAEARELERQMLDDHYRRWLDEPLEPLGGRSPREAAAGDARGELEALLRGIENRAERARRNGTPWPELGWLREELGLDPGRLAA